MKRLVTYFLSGILVLMSCFLIAQQNKASIGHDPIIDSLQNVLKNLSGDTTEVNTLNLLSRQYRNTGIYEPAMQYAREAQQFAKKLNYQKGIAASYNNIGIIYWYQGNYENALDNHLNALKIEKEIGDKIGIANSYNNIGALYYNQGNYESALENYLAALKIREEIGDKKGVSGSFNNIGLIYEKQLNYEKALDYHLKALKKEQETGDKKGIANSYNSIGLIYFHQGTYESALDNYFKSLKICEEIGDKSGIATSYNNAGIIYSIEKSYEKALNNYLKSLKIREEIGDKQGIGTSYNNVGITYLEQGLLGQSYNYLSQSLILSKEIGNKDGVKEAYSSLSDLYFKKRDYKQAFTFHKLYSDIKDTLLNEQSTKQIAEMNTKYDSEKKDKELIKKDAEISKQLVETEKQNLQRNAFIIGFSLVLVLAFFIFRGYHQKKEANKLLEAKNILIENQKLLVEEKNLKITDSINYARRIQQAILPSQEIIKSVLTDSFIFFKPKDIVSGDFYWMHAIDKNYVLLAAVDCTGHGVPGALMSMMGYNLLEQIVKEHHIFEPAKILNELSKLVVESLKQTNTLSSSKEAMDIALCRFDFQNNELEFAGAHNSLYLIRNGKLFETKADNRTIGISLAASLPFTNHKIKLEKGDCLYISSDGYADQFGGINNEKFYYQPFREMLTQIHQLPMNDQRDQLEIIMSEWKGDKEQIDDMLVIGVKI